MSTERKATGKYVLACFLFATMQLRVLVGGGGYFLFTWIRRSHFSYYDSHGKFAFLNDCTMEIKMYYSNTFKNELMVCFRIDSLNRMQ